MGCVSSKILARSGSFQESVSHSFQRSNNVIEEIILSSSRSNNGDQFLALLRTSSSSSRRVQKAEQQSAAVMAPAEQPVKIETINVSELLAGLEEEENCAVGQEKKEQQGDRKEGGRSPAKGAPDGGVHGRARSFRTVEEFDALVTQSSSSESATAPAPEEKEKRPGTAAAITSSHHGATGTVEEISSPGQIVGENAGAKRRARARQLGELKVPTTFDFSKSGSLRDWLLRGGQIFSPGSYVTPKFGTPPAASPSEDRGGEKQHAAVFDPELVSQFERAMEQLSEDEERVLTEILHALELETGEKDGAASGRVNGQPVPVAAPPMMMLR